MDGKNMSIRDFYNLVELKSDPQVEMLPRLQALTKKYPYFQAGIFTYVKGLYLYNTDDFNIELQRLAPFVQDRKALFYYVLNAEFAQFRKKATGNLSKSRTEFLIDAFFDTLGDGEAERQLEHTITNASMASLDYLSYLESSEKNQPDNAEPTEDKTDKVTENISEDLIIEVVPDITAILNADDEKEDGKTQLKHQSIIDSFISNAQNSDNIRVKLDPSSANEDIDEDSYNEEDPSTEKELDDDFFFTQTLANIYIKQKKYQRAYEIIKRLSLNYPEKNTYFADQLSFLEKIIENLNHKK